MCAVGWYGMTNELPIVIITNKYFILSGYLHLLPSLPKAFAKAGKHTYKHDYDGDDDVSYNDVAVDYDDNDDDDDDVDDDEFYRLSIVFTYSLAVERFY